MSIRYKGRTIENSISIIVTIFNVDNYLVQCLDSIINQTILPKEIILVDDGSTDRSGVICDQYKNNYSMITVIHQENQGVSAARLSGYKHAKTEYILFIDGDDFVETNLIERCCPYINKNLDVITFGIVRYHNDNYMNNNEVNLAEGIYEREYLEENVFPTMIWDSRTHRCGIDAALWNKIVRKHLYEGYLQEVSGMNIHYGEDVALVYLALLKARNMGVIQDCLYYHRQRSAGVLANYVKDEEYIDKLHLLYSFLKKNMGLNEGMLKQLEYFYLHALEVRIRIYGDYRTRKQYIFPFDKVESKKKVILYGAGEIGQSYHGQLTTINYCKELLWVDENYKNYSRCDIFSPDMALERKDFDYVVIAIISQNAANEIKQKFINRSFLPQKIIWCIKC